MHTVKAYRRSGRPLRGAISRVLALLVIPAIVSITGCGGGTSDSMSAVASSTATIKAATVTYGRVTGVAAPLSSATAGAAGGAVGGVTVNGVRYDDSNATYADDLGAVLTAGQIGLGMMVAVEGDVDSGGSSGVARRIVVMDDIVAPLVDVDLVGRTVTVPGARAQVGATTVLVGVSSLEALSARRGEVVVIHGPLTDLGVISATRIELRGAPIDGMWFKGRGVVRNLIPALTDFELGPPGAQAAVCYCHSLRDPTEPVIGEGRMIRVWSLTSPVVGTTKLWVSDKARVMGTPVIGTNAHVEVDGIWQSVLGPGVDASASGQIGAYPIDLSALSPDRVIRPVAGQYVAIKGSWLNGRLVATRASILSPAELVKVQLTGVLQSLANGFWKIGSDSIALDSAQFESGNLQSLAPGVNVSIEATLTDRGLRADRVQLRP